MRGWLIITLALLLAPIAIQAQTVNAPDTVMVPQAMLDSILSTMTKPQTAKKEAQQQQTDSVANEIAAGIRLSSDSLHTEKKKPAFVPNPRLSLWFSLIPGGGQIYNRKYWKLPIVYGGFFGCIYALNWNNRMYQDYQRAYIDIMDDDPATASYLEMLPLDYDITGKEDRFKDIFKRKKDYFRRYRDMSIFIMVAVWALATVDAYVDAELSTFDISKDLSLRLTPAVFGFDYAQQRHPRSIGGGIQMSLHF